MKKRKWFTALTLAVAMGMTLAACSTGSTNGSLESIRERGAVRVGVFSDKPPFGYVDEKGSNQGFDIFLAKRMANDLLGDESKIEFVLVEAASRVEFLQSSKVDLLMANFTVTDERKQRVDFADPYMKVSLGVVSPDGSIITDVEQLKGKKLIVNKGTTAETYFTKNFPEIELLKYEQNTEAFEALKDGRGAAMAHDNTLLFAWAAQNEGFSVGVRELGNQDFIAPAVKKGNTELLEWVNNELKTLASEDYIYQAYDATLKPVYGDQVKADDVVVQSTP